MEENPLVPTGNILILAGDIILFSIVEKADKFFDFVSANFETTYWIPGNHEYYNSDIGNEKVPLFESIRSNVFLVNNYSTIQDGVKIIFSTLWTKIGRIHEADIRRGLNDFYQIKNNGIYFDTSDVNQLHKDSVDFINKLVNSGNVEKTIVVSHHVPTFFNYPEKYKTSIINEAFASEMYGTIEDSNVDYWIYGHHHCNVPEFTIGKTKLITNQLGYVSYNEHKEFNQSAIIAFK